MSSHHFVKEGQEPALFIVDNVSFDAVTPLLEWVPLVLVTDKLVEFVSQWGIKIDIILSQGQVDENTERIIAAQHPVQVLEVKESAISDGMKFLIRAGYGAVNLVCQASDDVFRELECFDNRIQLTIHDADKKWFYITGGRFQKWMPAGIRLFFKDRRQIEKIIGLASIDGVWKTVQSGMVILESKTPFWIGEENVSTF